MSIFEKIFGKSYDIEQIEKESFERGRAYEQKLFSDWIIDWDGRPNSTLAKIIMEKINKLAMNGLIDISQIGAKPSQKETIKLEPTPAPAVEEEKMESIPSPEPVMEEPVVEPEMEEPVSEEAPIEEDEIMPDPDPVPGEAQSFGVMEAPKVPSRFGTRAKVFAGRQAEELESEINRFLDENPDIEVISTDIAGAPSAIYLTVFYRNVSTSLFS